MYYQLTMSHLFSITVRLEHPFIVLQHYTYSLILALLVANIYIDLKVYGIYCYVRICLITLSLKLFCKNAGKN